MEWGVQIAGMILGQTLSILVFIFIRYLKSPIL